MECTLHFLCATMVKQMQYLGWHYGTCKEGLNKFMGGGKASNVFCGKSSLMKKKHMLEIRFGFLHVVLLTLSFGKPSFELKFPFNHFLHCKMDVSNSMQKYISIICNISHEKKS